MMRVATRVRDAAKRQRVRSPQIALGVFVVWVAAAVPIILFGVGSYYWFFLDDFSLLTGRDPGSLEDLFTPHAGAHWSTLPILAWHALYSVFGLRSYVPYQLCVVALHLGVCVVLRVIMRRVGVGPWIATAAAGSFILFGPGQQNILWAFQIGFTGSLAFGLVQLVLTDHDGPLDKRDAIGVGFGFLALLSSSVGIATALVVGMATLARRGWQVALVHCLPLAVAYVLWFAVERPTTTGNAGRPGVGDVLRWLQNGVAGIFESLAHFTIAAWLLGAVVVIGLVLVWAGRPLAELRKVAAMPAAMAVGAIAFSLMTSLGRWTSGASYARTSRYLHIGVALALPLIAVAADAIARRWRVLTVPIIVLLLLAVPWNATNFDNGVYGPSYMDRTRAILTNAVDVPGADQVPAGVRPITERLMPRGVDMGFLRQASDEGKLDAPSYSLTPSFRNELRLRVGIWQHRGAVENCRPSEEPIDLDPAQGTAIGFLFGISVVTREGDRLTSPASTFDARQGAVLEFVIPDLHVRLTPAPGLEAIVLCTVAEGDDAVDGG